MKDDGFEIIPLKDGGSLFRFTVTDENVARQIDEIIKDIMDDYDCTDEEAMFYGLARGITRMYQEKFLSAKEMMEEWEREHAK